MAEQLPARLRPALAGAARGAFRQGLHRDAGITLILAVLGPAMAPWPLPLCTLLLSVLMVVAMTWLVMPSLTRLFRGWLTPVSAPDS